MANPLPIMPKATAVWLIDNTTLTFEQIAEFVGMHLLEINGIADGDVAVGIKGADPIVSRQLTREEIARCEADPAARLELSETKMPEPPTKRRGGRFVPIAIRQNRPAAIAWLIRYHPELSNAQIIKLVGTTKSTIESVRDRSHWNIRNIRPMDPVALGLCSQMDLDGVVEVAASRKEKSGERKALTAEERRNLLASDESLAPVKEPVRPVKTFEGLENFSLSQPTEEPGEPLPENPDSLFNLPESEG